MRKEQFFLQGKSISMWFANVTFMFGPSVYEVLTLWAD